MSRFHAEKPNKSLAKKEGEQCSWSLTHFLLRGAAASQLFGCTYISNLQEVLSLAKGNDTLEVRLQNASVRMTVLLGARD